MERTVCPTEIVACHRFKIRAWIRTHQRAFPRKTTLRELYKIFVPLRVSLFKEKSEVSPPSCNIRAFFTLTLLYYGT